MNVGERVYLVLFLVCVAFIFYSYVLFPLFLRVLSSLRRKQAEAVSESPADSVSILIPVYNEGNIIAQKIQSVLDANYPNDRLEILVGSDASDDHTSEEVRRLAGAHPSIRLIEFRERRGKPAVVNDLVREARFDLLLLTDANVLFEKSVIERLLRSFGDQSVGLAGANILSKAVRDDGISRQEQGYLARENVIKQREGELWGCMMGPFGGCYAIRKNLYVPIPEQNLVDDFFVCMKVIEQKRKSINVLDAICYEDVSNDIWQEYRRKARISAGNFQNLAIFKSFLLRPFSPAGFCFISHKVLRWFTPFLIILSFISLGLLASSHELYAWLFAGEALLLVTPLLDTLMRRMGIHISALRYASYFILMNLALLQGFFRYLNGIQSGVWTPTKRVEE